MKATLRNTLALLTICSWGLLQVSAQEADSVIIYDINEQPVGGSFYEYVYDQNGTLKERKTFTKDFTTGDLVQTKWEKLGYNYGYTFWENLPLIQVDYFGRELFRTYHSSGGGWGSSSSSSSYEYTDFSMNIKYMHGYSSYYSGSYYSSTSRTTKEYYTYDYGNKTKTHVYDYYYRRSCGGWCGGTTRTNRRTTTTYEDEDLTRPLVEIIENGDTNNENWVNTSKNETTYDGLDHTLTQYTWNGSSWIPQSKYVYGFFAEGVLNLSEAYSWNGLKWVGQGKLTKEFDASGGLLSETRYTWDAANDVWIASGDRTTYELDEEGRRISALIETWDATAGAWINKNLETRDYDLEGRLILILSQTWNEEAWVNNTRSEWEYDENGNTERQASYAWEATLNEWNQTGGQLRYIDYNENEEIVFQEYYEWDRNSQKWIGNWKMNQTIDEKGRVTFYEYSNWNSTLDDWYFISKYEKIFDAYDREIYRESYSYNANLQQLIGQEKWSKTFDENYRQTEQISFRWDVNESVWYVNILNKWGYDEAGYRVLIENYQHHAETNTLLGTSKTTYQFDEKGRVVENLQYTWDQTAADWSLSSGTRYTYEYNENNQIVLEERVTYNVELDQWVNATRTVYRFDDRNQVELQEQYNWSIETDEWVQSNGAEYVRIYNEADVLVQFEQYNYDNTGMVWVGSSKWIKEVDAFGQDLSITYYDWDLEQGVWVPRNSGVTYVREYDEEGRLILFERYNSEGEVLTGIEKWATAYGPVNIQTLQSTYNWDSNTSDWVRNGGWEKVIDYDENGFMTEYEYKVWNQSLGAYQGEEKTSRTYYENGQQRTFTGYNWDADQAIWVEQERFFYVYELDENDRFALFEKYNIDTQETIIDGVEKYEATYDDLGNYMVKVDYTWDYDVSDWVFESTTRTYADTDKDGYQNHEDASAGDPAEWFDKDGVGDDIDECPGTVIPDEVTLETSDNYPLFEQSTAIDDDAIYDFYGQEITEEGRYFKYFVSRMGCDSVVDFTLRHKARQIISLDNQSRTYGDDPFDLQATSSSGKPISYTSSDENILTLDGRNATILAAGEVTVTASQEGDDEYSAGEASETILIEKAVLSIIADDQTITYGDPEPAYTFSYEGFVYEEDPSVLLTEPEGVSRSEGVLNAGEYSLEASQEAMADNYSFNYFPGTLLVEKAQLGVIGSRHEMTYGDSEPVYFFTLEGFVNEENADVIDAVPSSVSATGVQDAGEYLVAIARDGSDNNYDFNYQDGSLMVRKADLHIGVQNATKIYGKENPEIEFVYEGFRFEDSSNDLDQHPEGITEASASSDVGTYDVLLTEGQDKNYNLITTSGILEITKAELLASADNVNMIYGDEVPDLTITYEGLVNEDSPENLMNPPTTSTVAGSTSDVGDYLIDLSEGSDKNYTITSENGTLTITKAALFAIADNQAKIYGEVNPELTVTFEGFVNADGVEDLDSAPETTTEADELSNVGDYDIMLSEGMDNNYEITISSGTLSVTKAALLATADNQTKIYGEANPELTVSFDGFVNGDAVEDLDSAPEANTEVDELSDVGHYDIMLSEGTDNNYEITISSGTLSIIKAALLATADNQTKIYGEANPELTVSFDGFVNGDAVEDLDSAPEANTEVDELSDVGHYDIMLSEGTDNNYLITTSSGTLSVTKAALLATADNQTKIYGEVNPELTVSFDGFVNGDEPADLVSTPLVTTEADETSDAGEYVISLSSASDNNYDIEVEHGVLTIEKADQSISFDPVPEGLRANAPSFELSAEATSELPVMFTSSDENIVSLVGAVVSMHAPGEVTLTALQEGDHNHNAAESVTQTFTVAQVLASLQPENLKLKIYPNPVVDYFSIDGGRGIEKIHLVNLNGQIVRSFEYRAGSTYDISALRAGLYMLLYEKEGKNQLGGKISKTN